MIEKRILRTRESDQQRMDVVNELNFTYRGLLMLLPMLMRRMVPPLTVVLAPQEPEDRSLRLALRRVAVQHGYVPRPCVCEDANNLLSEVYHLERATTGDERVFAVLTALHAVRTFLLRAWARLIDLVEEEELHVFRKEVILLQKREAEQHRELLALERRLIDGSRLTA